MSLKSLKNLNTRLKVELSILLLKMTGFLPEIFGFWVGCRKIDGHLKRRKRHFFKRLPVDKAKGRFKLVKRMSSNLNRV